jgi:hypothetical protein
MDVIPLLDGAFVSLASERGTDAAGEGEPDPIRELLVIGRFQRVVGLFIGFRYLTAPS